MMLTPDRFYKQLLQLLSLLTQVLAAAFWILDGGKNIGGSWQSNRMEKSPGQVEWERHRSPA